MCCSKKLNKRGSFFVEYALILAFVVICGSTIMANEGMSSHITNIIEQTKTVLANAVKDLPVLGDLVDDSDKDIHIKNSDSMVNKFKEAYEKAYGNPPFDKDFELVDYQKYNDGREVATFKGPKLDDVESQIIVTHYTNKQYYEVEKTISKEESLTEKFDAKGNILQ